MFCSVFVVYVSFKSPCKDLERYRQQCMTNGEVAGITGEKVNFMDLAGKMVGSSGASSAGNGRAFLGDTMSLDGLKGLTPAVAPSPSPKKKDEEEDGEPGNEEEKKEKEKIMWFDRDKAVSSAKRSGSTSTLELKQKLEKQISDTKQAMAEFENPLYAGMFMNEKAVAKKGLDGLEAVLGDDESALQAYMGSFDKELGASGKKTIGKAPPPFRNYADLLLISKIQGKIVNDYGQEEVLVLSSPPRRVACAYPCPCRPPRSPLLTPPRQVTPADRGEGVESLLHGRPRCIRGREHPG